MSVTDKSANDSLLEAAKKAREAMLLACWNVETGTGERQHSAYIELATSIDALLTIPPVACPVFEGLQRIAAERHRQVAVEGFDAAGDDVCTDGRLAAGAAFYALPLNTFERRDAMCFGTAPHGWPWPRQSWKPAPVTDDGNGNAVVTTGGRIRELEKAGGLIAAEIDRLIRLQAKGGAQ